MNVRKIILEEYRRQRSIPFAWGTADCLDFAARCATPVIKRDPIAHLRGRYDSEVSAKRVMIEEGWNDMADVVASIFPETPLALAQSGDWARVINSQEGFEGTEAIGVVIGSQIASRTQDGVGFVSLLSADKAFRVS